MYMYMYVCVHDCVKIIGIVAIETNVQHQLSSLLSNWYN